MASKTKASEALKVVARCRPLSRKEEAAGHEQILTMDVKLGQVTLRNPRAAPGELPKSFTFDAVYDASSKQADLYDETVRPLVDSVLQGFNGTVFAYGQTGTGKTYTMQGTWVEPELRGVIPNAFEHIFTHISRSQNQQYLVRASYLEIYQEEIRDLLSKEPGKRLELKENPETGVYIKDLSSFVTKNVKEIEHVMNLGNQTRAVGSTHMNEVSSRSHAIFVITVCPGQRDRCSGGQQEHPYPLPGLQADPAAPRLSGGERQDHHGGHSGASFSQLRREPLHPALCQQGQEHQEQAPGERGSQGHAAAGIPGGDRPPEGPAGEEGDAGKAAPEEEQPQEEGCVGPGWVPGGVSDRGLGG